MNKVTIAVTIIFAILIGVAAHADCQVLVITPCAGCQAQQQMVCDYSAPPAPQMPMRNGMQEFYQGAEAFKNGVNAYGNSIRR